MAILVTLIMNEHGRVSISTSKFGLATGPGQVWAEVERMTRDELYTMAVENDVLNRDNYTMWDLRAHAFDVLSLRWQNEMETADAQLGDARP